MKKITCLAMGAVMMLAAQTSAMAAGAGTVDDPKTNLPHLTPMSMNLGSTTDALTIKCLSTDAESRNTLQIPTKSSVACKIKIAAGTKLTVNNSVWYDNTEGSEAYEGDYSFDAGSKTRLIISDGEGNTGAWEISVPALEKDAPKLQMSGPNLTEEGGKITSGGNGYMAKDIASTMSDATGIKCIYYIPYTDDTFTKVDEFEQSGVYYDKSHAEFLPTGDITYNGTTILAKGTDPKDLSEFGTVSRGTNGMVERVSAKHRFNSNGNRLIVLEDVYGNQSKFQLMVTGISQINDNEAPAVTVEKVDVNYESDGKTVKSVKFNLNAKDAPAGLKSLAAKLGDTEVVNVEGLAGQQNYQKEFTVNASDKDKVLQVKAADINDNKLGFDTAYTIDLSKYFTGDNGGSNGGNGNGDNSGNNGGSQSTDKVKPSFSASYDKVIENNKVTKVNGTITFTSVNGLKKVEIYNGTSKLVSSDIVDGKTTATFKYTLDSTVQNKVLKLIAEDIKGNKLEDTLDLTEQFNNGSGGNSGGNGNTDTSDSKVNSSSQLRKLLGDPEFEYDEDETTVTFKLDKSKTGNIDPSWYLKNPAGKTIDESENEGVYTFAYTFEKGEDKPGDYTMKLEDKDGHKVSKSFYVDYRDDSDIAQALTIEKELDEDAKKVFIKLGLNKDKIDESGDARWTFYKDSSYDNIEKTSEGRTAEFEVKKDGTYYFKVKCDGETYKFKVPVTEFDQNDIETDGKDDSNSNSNNTTNNNNNKPGEKPVDTTNSKVPQPVGTPVVSNITPSSQTITITMADWNKEDWKIAANSFPSGVAYSQPSGTNDIVLTVPNRDDNINFIMENVKTNKQIKLTVKTYAKNTDGSDKNSNVTTGGAGSAGVVGGTLAYDFKPMDLTFRGRKGKKDENEGNDFID